MDEDGKERKAGKIHMRDVFKKNTRNYIRDRQQGDGEIEREREGQREKF